MTKLFYLARYVMPFLSTLLLLTAVIVGIFMPASVSTYMTIGGIGVGVLLGYLMTRRAARQ